MNQSKVDYKVQRNNSIDIFRVFAAILVIAIHTHPLSECSTVGADIIREVIARVAVPFFFSVSGYYFIRNLAREDFDYKRYIFKVVKVYTFCSILYFPIDIVNLYLAKRNVFSCIISYIIRYLFVGNHAHLWYFPALIWATVIVYIFRKRLPFVAGISIVFYGISCLGYSYGELCRRLAVFSGIIEHEPFLTISGILGIGLPFVCLGYYLDTFMQKKQRLHLGVRKFLVMLTVAGFCLESI